MNLTIPDDANALQLGIAAANGVSINNVYLRYDLRGNCGDTMQYQLQMTNVQIISFSWGNSRAPTSNPTTGVQGGSSDPSDYFLVSLNFEEISFSF